MPRVERYEHYGEAYGFDCPGCGMMHVLPVTGGRGWRFNHNLDRPTFDPSILARGKRGLNDDEVSRIAKGEKLEIPDFICHSYVRDGKIMFLSDCTHKLAGQTVDLPEIIHGP